MRHLINKILKKEKQAKKPFKNDPVVESKEFKALVNMNAVMNIFDGIESLGFDPMSGCDEYISARFSANAFMIYLVEKCAEKYPDSGYPDSGYPKPPSEVESQDAVK